MKDISSIVVKIECKNEKGSGFIYSPKNNSDHIYILTARHCIYGKKNDNEVIKTDIKIVFFDAQNNLKKTYDVDEKDDLIHGETNEKEDVAIIIIHRNNLKKYLLENIQTPICFSLKGDEENCFINGYPKVVSNKFPVTLYKCLFTPDKNEYPIHVEISDIVATHNYNHNSLVEGYSGSGVFVDLAGRLFVCGIVSKYKKETRRFSCNDFLLVNQILSSNSYKEIPLVEINTNQGFVNCLEKMDNDWFKSQVEVATNNLGKRYTPDLNFELDIAKIFDGITRGQVYKTRITNLYDTLFIKSDDCLKFNNDGSVQLFIDKLKVQLSKIKCSFHALNLIGIDDIPFKCLIEDLDELENISYQLISKYYEEERKVQKKRNEYQYYHKYGSAINYLNKFKAQILGVKSFLESTTSKLVNKPILILEGDAGIGKSHLVGDIANSQIKEGKNTLLLLGQHFTNNNSPWIQLLSLLRIKENEDVFLQTLDFLGKEQNSRIILFIDAINEGNGRYFWRDTIQGFISKIAKYKWIGLVLSIRTTYKKIIIPEESIIENLTVIHKHVGFRGAEYDASKLFFKNYGIQQLSIPLLHPEFQNPLFLRVFCEGLKRLGYKKIPDGFRGISKIIQFYLKSIDKKLSQPNNFDYSISLKLVEKIIYKLIEYKLENNFIHSIPYDKAYDVVLEIESKYRIKNNFLETLISEGILTKNVSYDDDSEIIYITYERFEDHLSVQYLLKGILKENIYSSFEKGGKLHRFCSKPYFLNLHRGIYEALAIQLPEKYEIEIYEVFNFDDLSTREKIDIAEVFISSLLWREYSTMSEKLFDFINQHILVYEDTTSYFFDSIISVATSPNHLFNADKIHEFLKKDTLANRDAWWTQLIHGWFADETSLKRLIDWAWSKEDKTHISDEAIRLSAVMLCWTLTSSNRTLRDSASKGIICLLVNRIPVLLKILKQFEEVNDPYILERLYGCAYGCVLRTEQIGKLKPLVEYIYQTIFNKKEVYPHILLRDYARGIIEFTLSNDIELDIDIDKTVPPYKSTFPEIFPTNEEIDALKYDYNEDTPKYCYSLNSILSSMVTEYGRGTSGYGDFGRYTFESALSNWKVDANQLSNWCIKTIIEKYGYDVKKHGEFDRTLNRNSYDRHAVFNERIGKKYQWIAFFEILARVSDNVKEFEVYYDKSKDKYEGAWTPHVRDFEPTILFNDLQKLKPENRWWFQYEYSSWNIEHKEWLNIREDIPNLSELINCLDDSKEEWLNLRFNPSWEEPKMFGKNKYDVPHKNMFFNIRGYFVKEVDFENFIKWGEQKDFYEINMPEESSNYEIFYRENYWSRAYNYFFATNNDWEEVEDRVKIENNENEEKYDYEEDRLILPRLFEDPNVDFENLISRISKRPQPVYRVNKIGDVHIPYERYTWETSNDASKGEGYYFYKPSYRLFNGLNLKIFRTRRRI